MDETNQMRKSGKKGSTDPRYDHQPTREEQAERTDFCARLMAKCRTKSEIHRMMREKYGVDSRTIDRYMARVRKEWAKDVDPGRREEVRAESLAMYAEIMRDPKASAMARIRCRERIEMLHGLDVHRFEHSGPNGAPLPVATDKVIIVELPATGATAARDEAEFREMAGRLHVEGNGNGNGHGP